MEQVLTVAYGEAGNDRFGDPAVADPAANDAGNDQFYGGEGSDTLTWDPGDGSDLFEGGRGHRRDGLQRQRWCGSVYV